MIKRILVCNIAYLGDVVLATSVLPALKQTYPEAQIGFLVGSWAKEVVEDHVLIDWVHTYDHPALNRGVMNLKKKRRRGKKSWKKALGEIVDKQYDIAFDLYSFYKYHSGAFLQVANIPERVGFWPGANSYFFNKKVVLFDFYLPMLKNHELLLTESGVKGGFYPVLQYKNPKRFTLGFENYILIHMGAGRERKKWPLNHWREVIDGLDKLGLPLVFIGKGEKESHEIKEIAKPHHHNLCDRLSWKELLKVVEGALFLVGLDSMAGHVASTLNIPAVLLYGEMKILERWGPSNPCCHVVTPPLETYVDDDFSLSKITPDMVLKKCLELTNPLLYTI